ncbi:MAG: hypothetical protein WCA35_25175 [Kovacikia sp.]
MTAFTPDPNPSAISSSTKEVESTSPDGTKAYYAVPEIIRASTPILLATVGGAMIIVALLAGKGDEKVYSSIATVATAAFSGAAGLAQPGKSKSDPPA